MSVLQESLEAIGYTSGQVAKNFEFVGEAGRIKQADLVVFGDEFRHDLATSCIGIKWLTNCAVEQYLRDFCYLATPLAIFLEPEKIHIFPVKRDQVEVKPVASLCYAEIKGFLTENRLEFSAEFLLRLKKGIRQITFFDVDPTLVQFAEEVTKDLLIKRFEQAIAVGYQSIHGRDKGFCSDLVRSVVRMLAARILEDKGLLKAERCNDGFELVEKARFVFGDYFSIREMQRIGRNVVNAMLEELSSGITYRAFSNEILGYVYENVLVSEEYRKKGGIYFTPRHVAEAIINRLPLEEIPPEERYVLDGSCGSGNLLLAACSRLGALLPREMSFKQKHSYLVEHIWGIDKDEFATEIARLSLILMSLPLADNWRVYQADFLAEDCSRFFPTAPSIIVANPPFKYIRKMARLQVAKRFLFKYLKMLRPGGLLGIILPETFLTNTDCTDIRKEILNNCEVYEIWQLPARMIPLSSMELCVLLLKKQKPRGYPVKIQRVVANKEEIERFKSFGIATFTTILKKQDSWLLNKDFKMISTPLDVIWEKLKQYETLANKVKIVVSGIQKHKAPSGAFCKSYKEGLKLWLQGSTYLSPYTIHWGSQDEKYIDYSKIPRRRSKFEWVYQTVPKVLVNAKRARGSRWRITAAIDRVGYYPSESIHCIIPNDGVSCEEVAALLNSPVVNAWLDSYNISRTILIPVLESVPYPAFTQQQIDRIRDLVTAIEREKHLGTQPEKISTLIYELDGVIYDAYGLSEEEINKLERFLSMGKRPGSERDVFLQVHKQIPEAREGKREKERMWEVIGTVSRVDPDSEILEIEVSELNEGEPFPVRISEDMPGWLLREGVDFIAKIPLRILSSRSRPEELEGLFCDFRPHPYNYLSFEQLKEELFRFVDPELRKFISS